MVTFIETGQSDIIIGLSGDDTIYGGSGDDILSGGIGQDIYYFESGFGQGSIYEFEVGEDGGIISFGSGSIQ